MYRRYSLDLKKKPLKLHWILGGLVLLLLVVQVLVSNSIANFGTTISQTENKIAELTQENQLLEEKIASSSSLLAVSEKAKTHGFVKEITPQYFSNDIPVALKSN